jgi:pimeloyl-ACP methyl ester carboxylesterase
MGDPIFVTFYSTQVQYITSATVQQSSVQQAGAALLDTIGPAILVAHSQGGIIPWLWTDIRPDLVKGVVALEPTGPPFHNIITDNLPARAWGLTDVPLTYVPAPTNLSAPLQKQWYPASAQEAQLNRSGCYLQAEPARQLVNFRGNILLVTSESGFHAIYDQCDVKFLRQAGVGVEHWRLEDKGIIGNGHFVFMEQNSDVIAALLEPWISVIQ